MLAGVVWAGLSVAALEVCVLGVREGEGLGGVGVEAGGKLGIEPGGGGKGGLGPVF